MVNVFIFNLDAFNRKSLSLLLHDLLDDPSLLARLEEPAVMAAWDIRIADGIFTESFRLALADALGRHLQFCLAAR